MRAFQTLVRGLRLDGFARDARGASIVFVASSMFVLVGAAGLAFDAGRGYLIKARLSQAVDSAALAGGRSLTVGGGGDYEAQIQKYFDANFPEGFMGATITGPTISVNGAGTRITVQAWANVPTTLMRVLKVKGVQVSARSQVTRALRGLEVALVLDNSGSMDDDGKMNDLKDAAEIFLDVIYGSNETVADLHVAVVPFTGRSNLAGQPSIHPDAPPVPTNVCVNMRQAPHNQDDAAPGAAGTATEFTHYSGVYSPGHNKYEDYVCPNAAVLPLTQAKSSIQARINTMVASGCTRYDHGTSWAWRALSPNYRGLWSGIGSSLPLDYDADMMDKAVIVMTDGIMSDCTGDPGGNAAFEDNFEATCAAMKAAGIIVYTITFKLDDAGTDTLFTNCASGSARYFKSPNASELENAFTQIANDLTMLRLTQ